MGNKQEFEMTEEDLMRLVSAMIPEPAIMLHIGAPNTQQDRVNRAWCELGKKMGFDGMTVEPSLGKGYRFFLATPSGREDL